MPVLLCLCSFSANYNSSNNPPSTPCPLHCLETSAIDVDCLVTQMAISPDRGGSKHLDGSCEWMSLVGV